MVEVIAALRDKIEVRRDIEQLLELDKESARRAEQDLAKLAEHSSDPQVIVMRRQRNEARRLALFMFVNSIAMLAMWIWITWLNRMAS